MGGFFGAISKRDCVLDVFFGVDYHSHLGTGGAAWRSTDAKYSGFQRQIHNIENTPFRTKFGIGPDRDSMAAAASAASLTRTPSPCWCALTWGSTPSPRWGSSTMPTLWWRRIFPTTATSYGHEFRGKVNFQTELTAALINQKSDLVSGIRHAQGRHRRVHHHPPSHARGHPGRPGQAGPPSRAGRTEWTKRCCVSFESFAYQKLGYQTTYELGPQEIVRITAGVRVPPPAGQDAHLRILVDLLRLSQLQLRGHQRRGDALPQR